MASEKRKTGNTDSAKRGWQIAFIDLLPLFVIYFLILYVNPSFTQRLSVRAISIQLTIGAACIYAWRLAFQIYRQIWRFGSVTAYIRLLAADALACLSYGIVTKIVLFFWPGYAIRLIQALSICAFNLLASLAMRLVYAFLYQYDSYDTGIGRVMRPVVNALTGLNIRPSDAAAAQRARKIRVCIVGAGRVGTELARSLMSSANAPYVPVCFIDHDSAKAGRRISDIPVLSDEDIAGTVDKYSVQEIIFALPGSSAEERSALYEQYKETGCKIKLYDYPLLPDGSEKTDRPALREFDIEDLLYRQRRDFVSEETAAYYTGKTVLISGGGGSIGSELCRQIARMKPKKLVILDVYENGAYDIQQELRIAYGKALDLSVEILSVTDAAQLREVFAKYRPEVVLHAAAHKHVPLMEHNILEAVQNNVFGTLNIVRAAEEAGVRKFIMISTDKAVNPTNVMGATKRMCEMIVLSHAGFREGEAAGAAGNGTDSAARTSFSCTRFGNVLGSNGSVIPLFKRQIAAGGPITITDKRIIRYFMTIPEASQLVLTSGAMAKNGELFVLDMGKPVRIYDLAVNMIRLSGLRPEQDIQIVETGLRPGEKLYEELLIKTENLDKTGNELIFVERQQAIPREEVEKKLSLLREALATGDNEKVREALHEAVPTFRTPEEVNAEAMKAEEMKEGHH